MKGVLSMGNAIFGIVYVLAISGAFCLMFLIIEGIFNLAYALIPSFRNRWDRFCETLPDWDDEDEVF